MRTNALYVAIALMLAAFGPTVLSAATDSPGVHAWARMEIEARRGAFGSQGVEMGLRAGHEYHGSTSRVIWKLLHRMGSLLILHLRTGYCVH